jgi:hypothetical protein
LFPAVIVSEKNDFFSLENGFVVLEGTKQLHRTVSGDPASAPPPAERLI